MSQKFLPEEPPLTLVIKPDDVIQSLFAEEEALEEAKESAAVTALLAKARKTIRRQRRRYWAHVAISQALFMVAFYFVISERRHAMPVLLKFILAFFAMAICAIIETNWSSRSSRGEMDALIEQGGVRAVGPLLNSVRMNDCTAERKFLYSALTTLLPLLKASDAHLLTSANRRMLNGLLGAIPLPRSAGVEPQELHRLRLVILKALEQVGDETTHSTLMRLSKLKDSNKDRSNRRKELREAAQECLLHLVLRRGEDTARTTLLRGSTVETAAPETLLRAVTSRTIAANELLRPAETNESALVARSDCPTKSND